jgi:RNA polymerase sigma factor (sigma-70 family)
LDKSQAARVASRLASGERLGVVAADLGRPRSAVYRVALSTESAKLADAGVKYHDDPLYHADDPAEAESQVRQILDRAREAVVVDVDAAAGRIPKNLPPYLADLYRTPLLTPAMERALFLWFNFHKCRFAELRRGFDPQLANRRELAAMSRHHRLAAEAKQQIVTANLRLVVSVARKHLRPGLDLMELVSDGNVVLMRAVEGFDVHRGFKFSTYATLALVKGFARSVPQMQQDQAPGGATDRIAADPPVVPGDLGQLRDRDELRSLLVRLDPRERCVLAQEWELPAGIIATDPDVMERVADLPRRQRQRLQREALSKLRDYAEAVA